MEGGGRTLRESFATLKPLGGESGDRAVEELETELIEHDTGHVYRADIRKSGERELRK